MGYGQYSAGGGIDRTKGDMVAIFEGQGYAIASCRKGGKNRLDAVLDDGRRIFTLHETVVATLAADLSTVTLADGGWPTSTTRTAWFEALTAFGVAYSKWSGNEPGKAEREVVYTLAATGLPTSDRPAHPLKIVERQAVPQALPMLRGSLDDRGENFAVTYDGAAVASGSGASMSIRPVKLLAALYRIDEMARRGRGQFAGWQGTLTGSLDFELGDFSVSLGRSSRSVCVGCHTFRTSDVRDFMREVAGRYPDAVKPAKALYKRSLPTKAAVVATHEVRA